MSALSGSQKIGRRGVAPPTAKSPRMQPARSPVNVQGRRAGHRARVVRGFVALIAGLLAPMHMAFANPTPIPPDLSVFTAIEVELSQNSLVGSSSRSATASLTASGAATSATVTDATATGLPLTSNLAELGDGASIAVSTSGSDLDALSSLTLHFLFEIKNLSPDKLFEIAFAVGFGLEAAAQGGDALAQAALGLTGPDANPLIDRFAGADSIYGPPADGFTDTTSFLIRIDPGQTLTLTGALDVYGAVNFNGLATATDSYSAVANADIRIVGVNSETIPVPAPIALFAVAPLLAAFRRRIRQTGQ